MRQRAVDQSLFFIAIYSLLKSVLLFAVGFGALTLLHKNAQAIATHWIGYLHFDPNNKQIAEVLSKVGLINDKKLEQVSGLTFLYGMIFLTEGGGLLLRKQWAKYFTIVATALLIPVEVYSLSHHFEMRKVGLLFVSVVTVCFLIAALRREKPANYYYRPTVLFK